VTPVNHRPTRPDASQSPPAETSSPMAASAIAYLTQRLREGTYGLKAFTSDGSPCPVHDMGHVFAGFFVTDALGSALSSADREVLLSRVRAEKRDGLWGYCPSAPLDADDTAFVLRTLLMLGQDVSVEPLAAFYRHDVLAFATFLSQAKAQLTIEPSVYGNSQIHPEVNANIFRLLLDAERGDLVNWDLVIKAQSTDGSWPAYFYPGKYYGTYMFMRLCSTREECASPMDRATDFLVRTQNADGSWGSPGNAHETALALNALACAGTIGAACEKGIAFLLNHQSEDGSWACDRVIWEFYRQQQPLIVWRALDTHRVVTTSLCLKALRAFAGDAPCSSL